MTKSVIHHWHGSRRWNHFWFRTGPPHLMAVFRIMFGAFLLFYWLLKLPHVPMIFSEQGIVLPFFPGSILGGIFVPPPVGVAWVIYAAFILSLLGFTFGFFMRVTGFIALMLNWYYWVLSLYILGSSFDLLFTFVLLIVTFSGADRTFSLRMRFMRGSFFAWEPISILPQRLLAVQITATYGGVGWQKLLIHSWQSGDILLNGFMGRWATSAGFWIARLHLPLSVYDWTVNTVKAFEISIPFGLWIRKLRFWFMACGALFHISIAILMSIWWFLILIPAYIVFFEPEEVYNFLKNRSRGKIS